VEFGMAVTLCTYVVTKVKSFKSVGGHQHVNIAYARATVQMDDRQKQGSVPSLVLGVSALPLMFN
jgi:hypothetical protein